MQYGREKKCLVINHDSQVSHNLGGGEIWRSCFYSNNKTDLLISWGEQKFTFREVCAGVCPCMRNLMVIIIMRHSWTMSGWEQIISVRCMEKWRGPDGGLWAPLWRSDSISPDIMPWNNNWGWLKPRLHLSQDAAVHNVTRLLKGIARRERMIESDLAARVAPVKDNRAIFSGGAHTYSPSDSGQEVHSQEKIWDLWTAPFFFMAGKIQGSYDINCTTANARLSTVS